MYADDFERMYSAGRVQQTGTGSRSGNEGVQRGIESVRRYQEEKRKEDELKQATRNPGSWINDVVTRKVSAFSVWASIKGLSTNTPEKSPVDGWVMSQRGVFVRSEVKHHYAGRSLIIGLGGERTDYESVPARDVVTSYYRIARLVAPRIEILDFTSEELESVTVNPVEIMTRGRKKNLYTHEQGPITYENIVAWSVNNDFIPGESPPPGMLYAADGVDASIEALLK